MHLKLFIISLIFFTLTSANKIEDIKPILLFKAKKEAPKKQPERPKGMYIIKVSENNLYNKAQAEILKYKILIELEKDTIQQIIK